MKKLTPFALGLLALFAFAAPVFAAAEFEVKKVDVNLVTTPEYQVNPPAKQVRAQQWIAIDVSFDAAPDFTEDLTLTYYVYFAKRLFVGRVNHVSIQKGRDLHSVAYISPRSIAQILKGKTLTVADVENVAVVITKPGIAAPVSAKSARPSQGAWWERIKQEEGFVVDKSQTPFAPLSWDYYEALKPASSR